MSPPVASPPPRSPSPAAHKAFSRTLYGAALSAVLVIGCWPVSTSGTGGTGGSAGNLSGTDLQVCGGACQKLAACGASLDIDLCKSDCAANPALITCLRSVEASCDPLSSCAFDAFCVSNGYGSGAPVGGAACSGAGTCLVNCGGNVSQSCACSCGAQGSPSVASEYYNLFVCAYQHCSLECGPSGDSGSCNTCLANSCYAEAQNCP